MGRAHRHQYDYGAVVVIDSRLENEFCELFPPWILRELTEYKATHLLIPDLAYFYQGVQIPFHEPKK